MSIDLLIHAGTKFALHQWLDARRLGDNVQDTDPNSPTFGDYKYTHSAGRFYYWDHPSGIVTKSEDRTDPENPVVAQYSGFYGMLRFKDTIPDGLFEWTETSTAIYPFEGIPSVGGEGVTIIEPEKFRAQIVANGAPLWGGILGVGNTWSDPALWAFAPVMTGDLREFDGVMYESQIDFNPYSPTQYPAGWIVSDVVPEPIGYPEWSQPAGAHDAYKLNDIVTYQGETWQNTGSNSNAYAPDVWGWTKVS